jgi:hypothetical protein
MNWRSYDAGEGPEPLPPEELLAHRRAVVGSVRTDLRASHVGRAVAERRRSRAAVTAQAIARRSARVLVGVAATVVVTASLAGAEIITEPARAILPDVSERFLLPSDEEGPDRDEGSPRPRAASAVDGPDDDRDGAARPTEADGTSAPTSRADGDDEGSAGHSASKSSTSEGDSKVAAPSATTSTSAPDPTSTSSTSTTEPQEPSTTTTTEPSTTTVPDTTTTTALATTDPPATTQPTGPVPSRGGWGR